MQLKADMDLIKEMGFNSVRIVGLGELAVGEKRVKITQGPDVNASTDVSAAISDEEKGKRYLDAIAELLDIINKAELKSILLFYVKPDVKASEDRMIKVVSRFKNDTSIMAYDLFNEPLYFDTLQRDKQDVYVITSRWRSIIKNYAPNQLYTIGLEGIREVFEWDPNILDVDFISMHPYEYEPEQVRNELYWYGKYVDKPWMIGETALPADNDSITYEEQKKFAYKTLRQTYNCGAIGYSWWQYKDVGWGSYHADFLGVVNRKGETKTKKENVVIKGTPKPVAKEFKNFDPASKKDSCLCLSNYYNYSQHKSCRIIGTLTDKNNNPIEGGVILGWNQNWTNSYHTITKADGSFELLGDFPFYHWMASATRYSMVRGELSPDSARVTNKSIPTLNIGKLKVQRLGFVD